MSKLVEDNLLDSIGENAKGTILRSMAIFTAMELCGSFLTGKTGPGTTESNFKMFCESEYMPQAYHKISSLLYSIFRNGVAHSYVPKGAAHLTSDPGASTCHLIFFDSGICIYVPILAEDVRNGITSLTNKLKQDEALKKKYYSVFQELERIGKEEYQRFVKENNITTTAGNFVGDISISLD